MGTSLTVKLSTAVLVDANKCSKQTIEAWNTYENEHDLVQVNHLMVTDS